MTSRNRDFGRKYVSGAEKERKRKARDEFIKTQEGSMNKFLKIESINKVENNQTEETPDVSQQDSCKIYVKTNESQDFKSYVDLTHSSTKTVSTLKIKVVLNLLISSRLN